MLFNSYIFVCLFLPCSITGYFLCNKLKKYACAEYFLIGMSLYFYAFFNFAYLPIILISICFNFILGRLFNHNISLYLKKLILICGIFINIGILFYYKYMGFFFETINFLFQKDITITKLLLPLGISFFTFQQLSFVIDSYRGTVPRYSFRHYSLFVTFFPQLIAGPIVLHSEIIPQFKDITKKHFCLHSFSVGLIAFCMGMAKKVLIADTFGNLVNYGFLHIESLGTLNTLLVLFSYTMQIYFDFSGYCDMAIGIGKMFRIEIPINFNSPYQACSITEFWKRWHITLTRFLKTYLYFPLGGNRKGKARTYLNLFLVFFVSGLWHGANVTFLIWGILHGFFIVLERIAKGKIISPPKPISWLFTFLFLNVSFVFFRAETLFQAIALLRQLFYFNGFSFSVHLLHSTDTIFFNFICLYTGSLGALLKQPTIQCFVIGLVVILFLFILLVLPNTNQKIQNGNTTIISALCCAFILFYSIISFAGVSTFLYFNF